MAANREARQARGMGTSTFTALVAEQTDGRQTVELKRLPREALPPGEVLVAVSHSSLNYKDGLGVTGRGKIFRGHPMVPGIDLAGTVAESSSARFRPGDAVLATGWGLGEMHWGGFAELARVSADWLTPRPAGLDAEQAMAFGTAGFTAMLAVRALEERGATPGGREIVVTGAAGGVGSFAVALLARRGFAVAASTGRAEAHAYLRELGAGQIIGRGELAKPPARPLESERWGGAVDTVGGDTLASVLPGLARGGSVAVCGLAGGAGLTTTLYPLVMRGIALLGIDSAWCPAARRAGAWEQLAREFPREQLAKIYRVEPLAEVPRLCGEILAGKIRGRVVVKVA